MWTTYLSICMMTLICGIRCSHSVLLTESYAVPTWAFVRVRSLDKSTKDDNICQYRDLDKEGRYDGFVAMATGLGLGSTPAGEPGKPGFNKCGYCLAVQCLEVFGGSCSNKETWYVKVGDQCADKECNQKAASNDYNFDFATETWLKVMGPVSPGQGKVSWSLVPCEHIKLPITIRHINNELYYQRFVFQDVAGPTGRIDRAQAQITEGGPYLDLEEERKGDSIYWTVNTQGSNPTNYSFVLYQGDQKVECINCVQDDTGDYTGPSCFNFQPNSIPGCPNSEIEEATSPTPFPQPSPTPSPTPSPLPSPSPGNLTVFVVDDWKTCGGRGSTCPFQETNNSLCVDAQYPGYACGPDFTCVRKSEWYWKCDKEE